MRISHHPETAGTINGTCALHSDGPYLCLPQPWTGSVVVHLQDGSLKGDEQTLRQVRHAGLAPGPLVRHSSWCPEEGVSESPGFLDLEMSSGHLCLPADGLRVFSQWAQLSWWLLSGEAGWVGLGSRKLLVPEGPNLVQGQSSGRRGSLGCAQGIRCGFTPLSHPCRECGSF